MRTIWIEEKRLDRALARHEAFWRAELEEGPLMWVTAANAKPGRVIPEPASEEELWTNVDFVIAATDACLARTHFAGDALPVFCPWLGPDQFAAWLGAQLALKPRDFTSWAEPFVQDWSDYPEFRIAPDNRWWRLYLDILRESVRAGQDKWVTGYPDLHSGVDALSAIRGRDRLAMDLVETPAAVHRAMRQMTALWKWVVDEVSNVVLPAGQGTTNWTMGWSRERFLCIGQNDFTCMISPQMFEEFCGADNRECCDYVDWTIYHLDGPGAVRHVPWLLRLERLHCIQWIQGAGQRPPSQWLELLRQIQAAGKSVQLYYGGSHGGDLDLRSELDILCGALDPNRLFIWAEADSAEQADAVVAHARKAAHRRC
ncbi:MAG TPA: hypothetical protein P5205_12375 [Candidatus Paceibacterota bacterium]|nr:hypothetical protein [Verrucomicrobiota bacterium]HSA11156.1 hypothetical protein [Candidatus Paceibacterota bacterium]